MRDWLEKKSVKTGLVVTLILIWGYNSYSIVGMAGKNETDNNPKNEISFDLNQLKVPDTESFIYKGDFRNPFRPTLKKKVQKKTENTPQQTPKEKVRIPYLKLTGTVEKMALIQNQRKQLFFVSSGDTVEGAHVRYVTEDSVGLDIKGKEFNLTFNK